MKNFLMVPVVVSLLSAAGLGSAQTVPVPSVAAQMSAGVTVLAAGDVSVNPDQGILTGFLNTDVSWQVIEIPLGSLSGAALSGLTLATTGLPDNLGIALTRVTQVGNTLVLNVDVNCSNANAVPNGLANVTLLADGNAVAMFQVRVQSVAFLSQ